LGSGQTHLKGFENIDSVPHPTVDRVLDLRRKLPYQSESIRFIFSEHVFEHFHPLELEYVLAECYRVLQPNGELSFSIPDFYRLANGLLFKRDLKPSIAYKKDLSRVGTGFVDVEPELRDTYFFDHLVHQFGEHKFFYTFPVIKQLLKTAGFTKISKRAWNKKYDSTERKGQSLYISAIKRAAK
jgi:SAM-dependent methyltransferase